MDPVRRKKLTECYLSSCAHSMDAVHSRLGMYIVLPSWIVQSVAGPGEPDPGPAAAAADL